jgi:hypothetical protein
VLKTERELLRASVRIVAKVFLLLRQEKPNVYRVRNLKLKNLTHFAQLLGIAYQQCCGAARFCGSGSLLLNFGGCGSGSDSRGYKVMKKKFLRTFFLTETNL